VKEPIHDDERLSALLAGRLEGPERAELLAHLSTADEDYEVFANAAAILREMDEEDAEAEEAGVQAGDPPPHREVLPPSVTKSTRGWPRRTPRWIAISAVLVGLVVLGTLVTRGRTSAADPMILAASLENPRAGLLEGSRENPWGADRGPGTSENAAQAGVYLLRLAVAVQAEDADLTVLWALKTRDSFAGGRSEALQQIITRAGQPSEEVAPYVEQATKRVEDLTGYPDYLRVGAWAEAARRAAGGQDEAFFATTHTRKTLRRAERITRDNPAAQTALEGIRAALPPDAPGDWTALGTNLDNLLKAIAS
jgi:hypothetical protein